MDHQVSWFYALIVTGAVLEVAGDVMLKQWAVGKGISWFVSGELIYTMGAIAWAVSLKYKDLGKAVSIFMAMNVALVVVMGAVLYKEKLSGWNLAGVAMAICAIILCERE